MMIKRSKKKWKSKRPEVNRIKLAECITQSRNSPTCSNQNSGGRERQSRNPRKMKSPNNRSKYLWHRSKSVPSKTVSFSPYVVHRFAQGPHRVKNDVCRSNSCAGCKPRAGAKRSMASKKKLATERCSRHQHLQDTCLSADNVPMSYDNFHGVRSPGPARCNVDHMYPDLEYYPNHCSGQGSFFPSELSDHSSVPKYHNYRTQESCHSTSHGTSSSVGSAFVSDFGSNRSQWQPVKRSLHSTPGFRNWGADAKFDFLMAKYSEHNCPKTHPALSDYFSFQKLALDANQNIGNLSQNKPTSARLAASASSAQPRSISQTRSERPTQASSAAPSLFQYDNKYYTGFNVPYNYVSGRIFPNVDLYQSEAMRDLMYNTISQKYIDKSSTKGSSQIRNAKADPEINTAFQRRRSSSTSFPFAETSSAFGTKLGTNPDKYDFADDMRLMGRCHNMGKNSTFQSVMSKVRSGTTQRSRSSDASFVSGCNNYDDNDAPFQSRFGLDSGGEYLQSANRQQGSWRSPYGKTDSWKSSLGKYEHWKDNYSKIDDAGSSSKYAGRSAIRRSSCVNNSNEKIPNCLLTSESLLPTNSVYSSGWTTLKKPSAPRSDSKSVDKDSFFSRFDESESRRLYDKYACWGNANTSTSEHASRMMKDDFKDVDAKTNICGQGRDYTSFHPSARDKSVSPTGNRKLLNLSRGNFNSFLKGIDLSFELKDELGKHHSPDQKFDQLSIASECKNPETTHHFRSSGYLGARNLNMNQSQSKPEFQPSSVTSVNQSWKFLPCVDHSFSTDSTSGAPSKHTGRSASGNSQAGTQYSSYCYDSTASMLNSLVDQETDRLKKLADVIERQHDGSQDVNNDMPF